MDETIFDIGVVLCFVCGFCFLVTGAYIIAKIGRFLLRRVRRRVIRHDRKMRAMRARMERQH